MIEALAAIATLTLCAGISAAAMFAAARVWADRRRRRH